MQTDATTPSWQSTVIALALIALVGGILLVVYLRDGAEEALKVWGGLGALAGVVVGAIPAYFFGQQTAAAARQESTMAKDFAEREQAKREDAEDLAREAQVAEQKKAERAEQRAEKSEAASKALLAVADQQTVSRAQGLNRDLFQ